MSFIVADDRNISCISFRFRRGRAHSGRLSTLWREPGRVMLLILKKRARPWNRVWGRLFPSSPVRNALSRVCDWTKSVGVVPEGRRSVAFGFPFEFLEGSREWINDS